MKKGRKWKKKRCPSCHKKTNQKHICSGKSKKRKRKEKNFEFAHEDFYTT